VKAVRFEIGLMFEDRGEGLIKIRKEMKEARQERWRIYRRPVN
jgi:hypothetical protein